MSTVNLSPLPAHQDSISVAAGPSADLAATGFLGVLAFAVTIMLAGFALDAVLGVIVWTFRRAPAAVTTIVLTVAVGALVVVSARGA